MTLRLTCLAALWLSPSVAAADPFTASFLVQVVERDELANNLFFVPFTARFTLTMSFDPTPVPAEGDAEQYDRDLTFSTIPLVVPAVPASEREFVQRVTGSGQVNFFRDESTEEGRPAGWLQVADAGTAEYSDREVDQDLVSYYRGLQLSEHDRRVGRTASSDGRVIRTCPWQCPIC